MTSKPEKNTNLSPWLNTIAKLSGAGFSFLMLIILARNMQPEGFADFSVILAWLAIGTTLASFSMPLVLVRYVAGGLADKNPGLAKGVMLYSLALTILTTVAISILCIPLYYLNLLPFPESLQDIMYWVSLLFLASVLLTVLSGYLQGLKQVVAAELLINLTRPILLILGTLGVVLYGYTPISSTHVVLIYTLVSLTILIVSVIYAYQQSPAIIKESVAQFDKLTWFRTGSGFMAVSLVAVMHEKLDILLMSILSSPDETAIYAVAAKFSQTILTATIAMTAIMAPQLAEKMDDLRANKIVEINSIIHLTTKNMMIVTLIALVGFASAGTLFLALFGGFYTSAYWPLVILATGHFLTAVSGPSLSVATFIGETRIAVVSLLVGLCLNASLSLWLTPIYGAIGAAIAMAFAFITTGAVACVLIYKKTGLYTFIFQKK